MLSRWKTFVEPAMMAGGRSEVAFDGPTCRTFRRGMAVMRFLLARSFLCPVEPLGALYIEFFE